MPTEIKNLKKTANRILKAIKNKEKIIIYGDADLDGVCSVIILEECIKNLGAKAAAIYFPDREKEGYGITDKGLDSLKKYTPALLLVLDCGIGNFKEVKSAKKLGFELVIIEHHEVLDKLPKADIIVDPKQKGDKYGFKYFATVGIIFRLAKLLLKEGMSESLRKSFLELVAMATIADMMPRTDENEEMIAQGLNSLRTSWRPGIQALFELEPFKSLTLIQQVNKVNSLLNIRNVENGLPAAFRLLTTSDRETAGQLVEELLDKSIEKKRKVREIIEEDKDDSQGSIRAPAGFNVVEAMKTCSQCLVTYGGHPQAAGFKIKNENLEKFKECLLDYFD